MTKTPKKRKSWQEKLEDSKDLPRIEVGDEMIDDTALRSSGVRVCPQSHPASSRGLGVVKRREHPANIRFELLYPVRSKTNILAGPIYT